jgi:hypothetical protein
VGNNSLVIFVLLLQHAQRTHYLLFLVVATHVKELVKIIIFSCYHMQRKQFIYFGCDVHVKGAC